MTYDSKIDSPFAVRKKPFLIYDASTGKNGGRNGLHLTVRIDNVRQSKYLINFLKLFVKEKENIRNINYDFKDILKWSETSFSSWRITDKLYYIDFFITDGKPTAFIFISINPLNKKTPLLKYKHEKYFELYA
ncbi:MAG TPA: hypothetical protein VEC16_02675 [Alphaproteobacteria bacterium]|nr:hypothetical protein [Alphaproteobacteria bacterium]